LTSTGVSALDQVLGGHGYPDKSAVLVAGPPGIGKESLGYYFLKAGKVMGDYCLYVTRLPVSEVLEDARAFGWDDSRNSCFWLAREGGQLPVDLNNLDRMYDSLKEVLRKHHDRRTRIVLDIVSPLLALYPANTAYSFFSRLLAEMKRYDVTLVATIELGMHAEEVIVSMESLFDGYLEMQHFGVGFNIVPLFRIGKMRGLPPSTGYYRFGFANKMMWIERAEASQSAVHTDALNAEDPKQVAFIEGSDLKIVFNYLIESFLTDFNTDRLSQETSGWRSRGSIIEATKVGKASLYGERGQYGPLLRELLSRGLVVTRFFPGERGRGGEIVKLRIAYEKPYIQSIVERSSRRESAK
jgi:KaiC/GvpD/RAD55 family RecA-like ATPase